MSCTSPTPLAVSVMEKFSAGYRLTKKGIQLWRVFQITRVTEVTQDIEDTKRHRKLDVPLPRGETEGDASLSGRSATHHVPASSEELHLGLVECVEHHFGDEKLHSIVKQNRQNCLMVPFVPASEGIIMNLGDLVSKHFLLAVVLGFLAILFLLIFPAIALLLAAGIVGIAIIEIGSKGKQGS